MNGSADRIGICVPDYIYFTTGGKNTMLMIVFLISIAVLLFCIIKIKLNAFVSLLACAYGTGILVLLTYAGGTAPETFQRCS